MTDQADRDPLGELVRALRPQRRDGLPEDGFLAPSIDPSADALLARVVSQRRRRRRWPWRNVTFFVVGVSALVGAGVTTAVLLTREPDDPTLIVCRSSVDSDAVRYTMTPEPGVNALDLCRRLWTDGRLGTAEPLELTACAPPDRAMEVLPGDASVCATRGWEVAATDGSEDGQESQLRSQLSEVFTDTCFDRVEAEQRVQEILSELGLDEWSVDTSGFVDDRCNRPAPDVETKRVMFSPR